jgi:UDP-glucose 4-epimerase
MEREFPEDFARTAASRFRSATDISVTNSFYHYYALMTGRAVAQTHARSMYVETTLRVALRQMKRLGKRRDQDMFCLNDGSFPEISDDVRRTAVTEFLERYFPFPAPWEHEFQEQRNQGLAERQFARQSLVLGSASAELGSGGSWAAPGTPEAYPPA